MPDYEIMVSKRIDEPGYRWRLADGATGVLSDDAFTKVRTAVLEAIALHGKDEEQPVPTLLATAKPSYWVETVRYHAALADSGVRDERARDTYYRTLCGIDHTVKTGGSFARVLHLEQCQRCVRIATNRRWLDR